MLKLDVKLKNLDGFIAYDEIKLDHFGDKTLKFPRLSISDEPNQQLRLTWAYDNDEELFALYCLVNDIREQEPDVKIDLVLPYIPNARQDRNVSGRIFTLKYFARFINGLNFNHVLVLDPHSDVSLALLDRVKLIQAERIGLSLSALHELLDGKSYQVMYPDAGAAKKYGATDDNIVGIKHRNADGRIDSYGITGLLPDTKAVVIRDDICSYGGTFINAAIELRNRGVKDVYLIVSHCENNILRGRLFDHIDHVVTTDSIFTAHNMSPEESAEFDDYAENMEKMTILRRYRS